MIFSNDREKSFFTQTVLYFCPKRTAALGGNYCIEIN